MSLQMSAIMLGVKDVDRAKKFYAEGLGCEIDQDFPGFVRCSLGEESSDLALYEWGAAAQDAGVSAEGSGFRGVSFHFITDSRDTVDEVVQTAAAAGATMVKAPGRRPVGRVLRLLQRPGRLSVEGRHRRLTTCPDLDVGSGRFGLLLRTAPMLIEPSKGRSRPRTRRSELERLVDCTVLEPTHPQLGTCCRFTGTTTPYGRIAKAQDSYTHRLGWKLLRGPIPEGKELHHRCGVHGCWNPDHLDLVTHAENQWHLRRTHCKHGHRYRVRTSKSTRGRRRESVGHAFARASGSSGQRRSVANQRSRTAGSSWTTKGRIGSNGRPRAVARPHRPWTNPSYAGELLAVHWASESLWSSRQRSGKVYPPAGLEMVARPNSRWPGAASPMWRPCLLESGPPSRCQPRQNMAFTAKTHCKRGHPLSGPNLRIDPRTGARICRDHRGSPASLSRTQNRKGLTFARSHSSCPGTSNVM